MKSLKFSTLFLCLLMSSLLLFFSSAHAQDATSNDTTKIYLIIKNDGSQYTGTIISQNAREVHINTREVGELFIPKHEIREIRELNSELESETSPVFSTRYFITTNGLPLEKEETYVIWSIYGPDIQFGVKENLSLGLLTSWVGTPIIGSLKYSRNLGKNTNLAIGTLLGTGSWASPDFGLALPYGALTFGNHSKNISFSAGYGAIWGDGNSGGRTLFSVAGTTSLNDTFSFVFDSFIVPGTGDDDGGALLIPGLRLQTNQDKAFQIGFAAIAAEGELIPFPFPMLQWFRRF